MGWSIAAIPDGLRVLFTIIRERLSLRPQTRPARPVRLNANHSVPVHPGWSAWRPR